MLNKMPQSFDRAPRQLVRPPRPGSIRNRPGPASFRRLQFPHPWRRGNRARKRLDRLPIAWVVQRRGKSSAGLRKVRKGRSWDRAPDKARRSRSRQNVPSPPRPRATSHSSDHRENLSTAGKPLPEHSCAPAVRGPARTLRDSRVLDAAAQHPADLWGTPPCSIACNRGGRRATVRSYERNRPGQNPLSEPTPDRGPVTDDAS
jgi:hypothetical protein